MLSYSTPTQPTTWLSHPGVARATPAAKEVCVPDAHGEAQKREVSRPNISVRTQSQATSARFFQLTCEMVS